MINELLEFYSRCGKSLKNNGLKESVIHISEAINALELFQKSGLIILGGDLYKQNSSDSFESIYADWFYNGVNCIEGINEAKNYLASFMEQDVYVSFVIKSK